MKFKPLVFIAAAINLASLAYGQATQTFGPLSGVRGSNQSFTVNVPQDTALLVMDSEGSSNADPDGDLYYEGPNYTGSSLSSSNVERITRENPTVGTHRMRVYGYSDFSGFRLRTRTFPYTTVVPPRTAALSITRDTPIYYQIKIPADSVGASITAIYGIMVKLKVITQNAYAYAEIRSGTAPANAAWVGSLSSAIGYQDEELVSVSEASKTYYLKVYTYSSTPVACDFTMTWHSLTLAGVTGLTPGRETWIATHGRADNPTNNGSHVAFQNLVATVSQARTQDGAGLTGSATLDWSTGAADNYPIDTGLQGSQWITPAAKRAGKALKDRGFNRLHLNLIGHSWGTLVSHDLARYYDSGNPLARIVALDPAENMGFSYGLDGDRYYEWGLSFSARCYKSVSLFTPGGLYGDEYKARTAHIAIGMNVGNWGISSFSNRLMLHSAPVDAFNVVVQTRRTSQSSGVIWRHIGSAEFIPAWSSHYYMQSWWFEGGLYSYCHGMLAGTLTNRRFTTVNSLRIGSNTFTR
jgi:pimeloyl-ACP methyl ester carboxylesterase